MNTAIFIRKVITGEGAVNGLADLMDKYQPKKVMLFADPIIVQVGAAKKIESILEAKGVQYQIYSDIKPEPLVEHGDMAVKAVRDYGAELVIGVGGGSCLDLAKVAACLVKNEGSIADYLNLTGTKKLTNPGVIKILLPTTAGTGAEVTFNAVFSLGNTKDIISDENILADVAIVDPEFTYTLPPKVTAASGMDALTHALEAFTSKGGTELTDTLAIEAVRKISRNITTATWNGTDIKARGEMVWGSLIASLSYFNAGVHAVHALAYPLGGLFHISHGESNAVLLPYIFDYIWPSCIQKMVLIAEAMDLPCDGKSEREIALMVVRHLQNLIKDTGLPVTIKDYGIKASDLDKIAQDATEQKRLLGRCPRMLKLEDIRKVYQAAYDGKLSE